MSACGRRLAFVAVAVIVAAACALPARAASTVKLPVQAGGTGLDVVVAINVAPADGVTSMDFVYTYDPALLVPEGAFLTAYADAFTLSSDLAAPGTVRLSLSSATPLAGSGDVANVTFHVLAPPGTSAALAWVQAELNGGGIPSQTTNGRVDVRAAEAVIAVPDTALGSPGANVTVPVSTDRADGAESIDIVLLYNQAMLTALDVTKTPLTDPLSLVFYLGAPGEVRISMYGTGPIYGSGDLVHVLFQVTGSAGEQSPLNLSRGMFNENAIVTNLDDGLFTLCSAGAPEACNGVDDDCDSTVDEGFDVGAACSAGVGACERTGHRVCADDHAGTRCDAAPGTPGTETCNRVDDDCDGTVDDVAAPSGSPALSVSRDGNTASLSWTAVDGATGYDVARGGLRALATSAGDFTTATTGCLGDDVAGTTASDAAMPSPGDGTWYVVRGTNCGGTGTFDDGGPGQARGRDAGLDAAPSGCP